MQTPFWIGLLVFVAAVQATPVSDEELIAQKTEYEKTMATFRHDDDVQHDEMKDVPIEFRQGGGLPQVPGISQVWSALQASFNNISSTIPSFNSTAVIGHLNTLVTLLTTHQVNQALSNWALLQNVSAVLGIPSRIDPNNQQQQQPQLQQQEIQEMEQHLLRSQGIDITGLHSQKEIDEAIAQFKKISEHPAAQQVNKDGQGVYIQNPFYYMNRRPAYYPPPQPPTQPIHPYYFGYPPYQQSYYAQQPYYYRDGLGYAAPYQYHSKNPTADESLSDLEALAQLEELLREEETKSRSNNVPSVEAGESDEGRGLISSLSSGAHAVRSNVKSIIQSIHSNLPTVVYKTLLVPALSGGSGSSSSSSSSSTD